MIQLEFLNLKYMSQSVLSDTEILHQLIPCPQLYDIDQGTLLIDENVKLSITGKEEENLTTGVENTLAQLNIDANVEFLNIPKYDLAKPEFTEKILYWMNLRMEDLKNPFRFESKHISTKSLDLSEERILKQIVDKKECIFGDTIPEEKKYQGYILLTTENSLMIYAWTYMGMFYGIMSLCQLFGRLDSAKKWDVNHNISRGIVVPKIDILDYPQYELRGLVDDISRGQRPTLDNFKKFIRFLAQTKQNVFCIYMEDIVKIEKYPTIGKGRGRLTKEDIRIIQDYAEEWFITVIPGFELLGHMDNMLLEPELMDHAEFPGAQCLNISRPETRDFVRDLIAEVAPMFDSKVFAPICDESFDFGLRKSKKWVDTMGWGTALAEWYNFLIVELHKAGKELILFAHDILIKDKHVMQEIQKHNTLIYYWKYNKKEKHPGIDKLTKQGLGVTGGPAVFDWSRHYPYHDYAEKNMINMGVYGIDRGLIGLITTKWGDFFNENFRDNIYYGLAVNGQASWRPLNTTVDQMRESFIWLFYGSKNKDIIKCMDLLSKQNMHLPRWPNGMFNRYWYDPFVRKIPKKEYAMSVDFINESISVLKMLDNISKDDNFDPITANNDNLEYIMFSALMARHYGAKILISEASYYRKKKLKLAQKAQELLGYSGEPIQGGFQWLKEDIEKQLFLYKKLWLQIAVPQGLEFPERHFHVLQWYYEKALEDISNGIKPHAHQLQSKWIWISGRRTNIEWGNGKFFYFKKSFKLTNGNKKVKKVIVQAIANNHLNLSFNGDEIGSVFSRMSLSQHPLGKAVQWFDVTDKIIITEENLITVEAANWGYGVGGINILLHVEYGDETTEDLLSDESWVYVEDKPKEWPTPTSVSNIINLPWRNAKSLGASPNMFMGPISEPVWEKGWESSVTFIFAALNFFETQIQTFLPRWVYKKLFWLLKPVARLFAKDIFMLRKEK